MQQHIEQRKQEEGGFEQYGIKLGEPTGTAELYKNKYVKG